MWKWNQSQNGNFGVISAPFVLNCHCFHTSLYLPCFNKYFSIWFSLKFWGKKKKSYLHILKWSVWLLMQTSKYYLLSIHLGWIKGIKGAWVAQSTKCPTLDFGSGHDLRVIGLSPKSLLGILGFSLSQNKHTNKWRKWDSFSLFLKTNKQSGLKLMNIFKNPDINKDKCKTKFLRYIIVWLNNFSKLLFFFPPQFSCRDLELQGTFDIFHSRNFL